MTSGACRGLLLVCFDTDLSLRLEFFAKSYEWLIRLLIDLPNKPAVINTQIMALAFDTISMGGDLHLGTRIGYLEHVRF